MGSFVVQKFVRIGKWFCLKTSANELIPLRPTGDRRADRWRWNCSQANAEVSRLELQPLSDLGPTTTSVVKCVLYFLEEFRVLEGLKKKGGRADLGGDRSNREILAPCYDNDASLRR